MITEKYLWKNLTTLLAIYDGNDNLIQRFDYTDARMPISMTQDSQTYYLHYDQVGTLRAVSDSAHNIIKEITYDTFGNILQDTNENFKIPFGFAGGLHDRDTDLVHEKIVLLAHSLYKNDEKYDPLKYLNHLDIKDGILN